MESPGMRTLTTFLRQVERNAPVNFSRLCAEHGRGYEMVNRYISYCLGNGLIRVVAERRTRGRYPSKTVRTEPERSHAPEPTWRERGGGPSAPSRLTVDRDRGAADGLRLLGGQEDDDLGYLDRVYPLGVIGLWEHLPVRGRIYCARHDAVNVYIVP